MNDLTKNGAKRQGRVTITEQALAIRDDAWGPVREALREHLRRAGKGAASTLAHTLGVAPSQVHRWTCPVCEHDQEPKFSMGIAILSYISQYARIINV